MHDLHVYLYYWQDAAKWKTSGINFTHKPKISSFARQGRLIAPIYVKLGNADGHLDPLSCPKFYLNCHRGVGGNATPKISISYTF